MHEEVLARLRAWRLADHEIDEARHRWATAALAGDEVEAKRLLGELKSKIDLAHELFMSAMRQMEDAVAARHHRALQDSPGAVLTRGAGSATAVPCHGLGPSRLTLRATAVIPCSDEEGRALPLALPDRHGPLVHDELLML